VVTVPGVREGRAKMIELENCDASGQS